MLLLPSCFDYSPRTSYIINSLFLSSFVCLMSNKAFQLVNSGPGVDRLCTQRFLCWLKARVIQRNFFSFKWCCRVVIHQQSFRWRQLTSLQKFETWLLVFLFWRSVISATFYNCSMRESSLWFVLIVKRDCEQYFSAYTNQEQWFANFFVLLSIKFLTFP